MAQQAASAIRRVALTSPLTLGLIGSGAMTFAFSFAPLLTYNLAGTEVSITSWSEFAREATILAVLSLAAAAVWLLRTFKGVAIPDSFAGMRLVHWIAAIGTYGLLICIANVLDNRKGADLGFGFYFIFAGSLGLAVCALAIGKSGKESA